MCARFPFPPQPAICLCLLPHSSAGDLFLPESDFSNALSAPLVPFCAKYGCGPVSLLPTACSGLRYFTELCRRLRDSRKKQKRNTRQDTRFVGLLSECVHLPKGFPAKCHTHTHTHTHTHPSYTMLHWPASFSLIWNQAPDLLCDCHIGEHSFS